MEVVSHVPQHHRPLWLNTDHASAQRGLFLPAIDPRGLVLSHAQQWRTALVNPGICEHADIFTMCHLLQCIILKTIARPSQMQLWLWATPRVAVRVVFVCSSSRPVSSCCLLVVVDKQRFITLNWKSLFMPSSHIRPHHSKPSEKYFCLMDLCRRSSSWWKLNNISHPADITSSLPVRLSQNCLSFM